MDKLKNLNLDNLLNMKNFNSLTQNLIETTKNAIKMKNNDIGLKLLDNYTERPDLWGEFFRIALLAGNFKVVKHMTETIGVIASDNILVNSSLISLDNDTVLTNKDNKDLYLDIEIPSLILAAIGGDIDIFLHLLEKGSKLDSTGHIVLSKKNRNSVVSNIVGAAAYYGRTDLLSFLVEKYKVNINFKCIERKAKAKSHSKTIVKEYSDYTPLHLAVVSDIIEDNSIDILQLLLSYGADINCVDNLGNNILHQAVKFNKLRIVKFLIESKKYYNEDLNKDGQTPLAIAHAMNYVLIRDFLEIFSSEKVEDNVLLELIEDEASKKKSKKNKKKVLDNDVKLLGSTGYEQTFVLKPKKLQIVEQPLVKIPEIVKETKTIELVEKVHKQPYNHKTYDSNIDYEYHKAKKIEKDYYNYNNTNNYRKTDKRHIKQNYKVIEVEYMDGKQEAKNIKNNTNDKNQNVSNNSTQITKLEDKNILTQNKPKDKNVIIGLTTKKPRKESNIAKTEESRTETVVNKIPDEIPVIEPNNKKEEEVIHTIQFEEQRTTDIKTNNEIARINDFKDDEEESDDRFLTEEEINEIVVNKTEPNNFETKYFELEAKYEKLRIEKEKLEESIKSNQKQNHNNSDVNDLLELSNEELDRNSKIIAELTSRIDFLEGKNYKLMNEIELNNLKYLYSSKLGMVIDALNNLNIS